MEVRCPICRQIFKYSDLVYLYRENVVKHVGCSINYPRNIKDAGTYQDIIEMYSFFNQSIIH